MNNRMKPRPSLAKVITFGSLQAERCFSTEMLRTNSEHEKWIELPDIAGTERIGKCRNMSFAYFGKDRIIVTGGFEKSRPKQVSEMSTKRLPNFHSWFFFSHSLTAASDFIRSETTNDHRAAKNECGKRGSCIGDGQWFSVRGWRCEIERIFEQRGKVSRSSLIENRKIIHFFPIQIRYRRRPLESCPTNEHKTSPFLADCGTRPHLCHRRKERRTVPGFGRILRSSYGYLDSRKIDACATWSCRHRSIQKWNLCNRWFYGERRWNGNCWTVRHRKRRMDFGNSEVTGGKFRTNSNHYQFSI